MVGTLLTMPGRAPKCIVASSRNGMLGATSHLEFQAGSENVTINPSFELIRGIIPVNGR